MENNFYVGIVHHGKRIFDGKNFFRDAYNEKLVLYNLDNGVYLDLLGGICYSTDNTSRDYVLEDSLILTDIDDYKTNYRYLLSEYKEGNLTRMKKI